MRAVTEGRVRAVLAVAEGDPLLLVEGHLLRREAGALVGAVTERLVVG